MGSTIDVLVIGVSLVGSNVTCCYIGLLQVAWLKTLCYYVIRRHRIRGTYI